ncbi:MAG: hypothetical protein AAF517_05550 [Planctomycetota bacterium]
MSRVDWEQRIDDALAVSDPVRANLRITSVHYQLGRALRETLGEDVGANFHSWAVWGSRKAGVTIRQEDRDRARRDGMVVAGVVGCAVAVLLSSFLSDSVQWPLFPFMIGSCGIGVVVGGACGRALATWTRKRAASLILEGNRTVLDDIGRVTARYLSHVERNSGGENWEEDFAASLRPGATGAGGQDLLRRAFEFYECARCSSDTKERHEASYFANCLAILHEHIRLQPLIRGALPFLVRRCVTARLLTFSVGERELSVHDEVPPLGSTTFPETLENLELTALQDFLWGDDGYGPKGASSGATDWTALRQRMAYIVTLFRVQHLSSDVVSSPYDAAQLAAIDAGEFPPRPW